MARYDKSHATSLVSAYLHGDKLIIENATDFKDGRTDTFYRYTLKRMPVSIPPIIQPNPILPLLPLLPPHQATDMPTLLGSAQQAGHRVPSILMTGHPSTAIETAALELGASTILRKPVPTEVLRIMVEKIIREVQS